MFSADTLQQALVQDYGRLCTLANKFCRTAIWRRMLCRKAGCG